MERKKVSFEVEKKRFEVMFEGFNGGTWVLLAEKSRGRISSGGFERETFAWIQERLKVVDLKTHLGFNRKYRGKTKIHLLEICFNEKGRFIKIMEFATNQKSSPVVILEGEKGGGWKALLEAFFYV